MTERTYPMMAGKVLKDWYSIRIVTEGEIKKVFFLSAIHVNKEVEVTHSYSANFSDDEILHDRDLISWVWKRYGDVSVEH